MLMMRGGHQFCSNKDLFNVNSATNGLRAKEGNLYTSACQEVNSLHGGPLFWTHCH